jgi:hypothetical protein
MTLPLRYFFKAINMCQGFPSFSRRMKTFAFFISIFNQNGVKSYCSERKFVDSQPFQMAMNFLQFFMRVVDLHDTQGCGGQYWKKPCSRSRYSRGKKQLPCDSMAQVIKSNHTSSQSNRFFFPQKFQSMLNRIKLETIEDFREPLENVPQSAIVILRCFRQDALSESNIIRCVNNLPFQITAPLEKRFSPGLNPRINCITYPPSHSQLDRVQRNGGSQDNCHLKLDQIAQCQFPLTLFIVYLFMDTLAQTYRQMSIDYIHCIHRLTL